MSTRPSAAWPSRKNRGSAVECCKSGPSSALASRKTVTAPSNETPCFAALASAFRGSHSNTYLVYTECRGMLRPPDQRDRWRNAGGTGNVGLNLSVLLNAIVEAPGVARDSNVRRLRVRASTASEPRDRSEPAKRRARARVGEFEGRSPSKRDGGAGSCTRVRTYIPAGIYMRSRFCCLAPDVKKRPKPPGASPRKSRSACPGRPRAASLLK